MSAHTAGQWRAEETATNAIDILCDDSEKVIAQVISDDNDLSDEDRANGQIIAAVPAMLAALKHVSFYARINHGGKCKDYGEIVDAVLKPLGVKTGEL